jgi:predicted RNA binding protein YcfA (HicA-like mRNA interferase family)
VTYAELTRKLRRLGIVFERQARGSHEVWHDPKTDRSTIIHHHPGREIKNGTLRAILRDLGLSMNDLNNA